MADYKSVIESQLGPAGDFPACFSLSLHKAGSTLLHNMVGAVCKARSFPCANIPHILFQEGLRDREWNSDRSLLPLFDDGRVYVGFRSLPPFFEPPTILQERQSVLLVRDPRDALVSQYFSFGGKYVSHPAPPKNAESLVSSWQSTAHLDIDSYVLQAAKNYLGKLVAYQRALDFDKVLVRRYEDIYFDKRTFLSEIFRHFGLEVHPNVIELVAKKFDVRPSTEQLGKHIRKGAPGDHVEKLQPATIERLNRIFAAAYKDFGYELAGPGANVPA